MDIVIESRGRFTGRAEATLFKLAKTSVKHFFKECHPAPAAVHLLAFLASPNGNPRDLIKVPTTTPDLGNHPVGTPVVIFTEGTQGLTCLMSIPGISDTMVRELVQAGPYCFKKRHEKVSPTLPPAAGTAQEPATPEPKAEPVVEAAPTPKPETASAVPAAPKLTPLERLRATDTSEEEIERLKATMSSIIYREVGDAEVPSLLQVSVANITRATLEHMKLPSNSAGNYRGTIGNFYATRVALFGLKWDASTDPEAIYTDWIMDCELILDFVGGANKIAALTRVREQEVRERQAIEEAVEQRPPPTAKVVEEVALGGFAADAVLLDMAVQSLEGKRLAEEEVRLAEENAARWIEEIQRLLDLVEAAKQSRASALTLVAEAKTKLAQYVLSPEVLERVRAAKVRIDTLVAGLGL